MSLGDSEWVWWGLGSLVLSLMGEAMTQLTRTVCSVVFPDFRWLWRKLCLWQEPEGLKTMQMGCSFHAAWAVDGERALSFLTFLFIRPAPPAHPGGETAAENPLLWVGWLRTERSQSAWTSLIAAAAPLPIIPSHTDCWMLSVLQSQPANDMVKKELDMSCLLPSSAVLPLWSWQTSLLWSTYPELYEKNKGDSSSRTLRRVTGVLDEDTGVQRPCPLPHTIPKCILTKASFFWCWWYQFAALWWQTHYNLMVVLSPYSPLKCHMWTSRSCWQSRGILSQRAHVFLASGFFLWAQNLLLRSWCCCASAKFSPCCSFKCLPGFLNILAIVSLVTSRKVWKNFLKVEKQSPFLMQPKRLLCCKK